jgi:hypothetical protein
MYTPLLNCPFYPGIVVEEQILELVLCVATQHKVGEAGIVGGAGKRKHLLHSHHHDVESHLDDNISLGVCAGCKLSGGGGKMTRTPRGERGSKQARERKRE